MHISGCHDILMLGRSPIKWRQRPDMTIAVDWEAKPQIKLKLWGSGSSCLKQTSL